MKRIITIIILISTLIMCAACQPTPEKSAVQSKGDGTFEKKIKDAPVHFSPDNEINVSESFSAKAGNVEISVEAKVDMPEGITALPVIEGSIGTITEDRLKSILEVAMNGKTVYDPPHERTKKQIKTEIDAIDKLLSGNNLENLYDDESVLVFMKDSLVNRRAILLQEYKEAKKTIKKNKSDLEFKSSLYYMTEEEKADYIADEREYRSEARIKEIENRRDNFVGFSYQDKSEIYYLSCGISDYEKSPMRQINFIRSKYMDGGCMPIAFTRFPTEGYEPLPCTIDESEALKMTDEMLEKLGFSDFALSQITKGKYGRKMDYEYYSVTYRRAVNNVVTSEVPEGHAEFRPTYNDEHITFDITDEGIMGWTYLNPIEMGDTINEGVAVKGFDEILGIFRQQASLSYDCIYRFEENPNVKDPDIDPEENGNVIAISSESATVIFDSIKLRYIRIAEKDKKLTYLYVPAYIFSGKQTFTNGEKVASEKAVQVIINAIDGSIISSEDCY